MKYLHQQRSSQQLTGAKLAIVQTPPSAPHLPAASVSTFAFDTTQELLWTGNIHVSTFSRIRLAVPPAHPATI
jgi:hypothetical protein